MLQLVQGIQPGRKEQKEMQEYCLVDYGEEEMLLLVARLLTFLSLFSLLSVFKLLHNNNNSSLVKQENNNNKTP